MHCFGGKSRSASFVCAFLMSSFGWSFDDAYATLKVARPIVEINAGFECQLRAYGAANCDVYIAQQLLLRTRIRCLRQQRGIGITGTSAQASKSLNSNNNYANNSSGSASAGAKESAVEGIAVGNSNSGAHNNTMEVDSEHSTITTNITNRGEKPCLLSYMCWNI